LITERLDIPTIGIGAGGATSGQVLVFHDLLGLRDGKDAKFVRRYAELRTVAVEAVATWSADVRSGAYPAPEHIYSIEPGELADLQQAIDAKTSIS
jgi:3-methyl-2-oxobutanoate hydroxymethyltransferase